jgi:indolepyruvate ferredoxin oxidoreductase beta subunit
MKKDIILAGVGGQGILSIAATIGLAAVSNNLHIKQAEVHGMSQRGGAVQSHLRVSTKPVHSDLIPKGEADIIIAIEPMESLRYINMLAKDAWVITNINPEINIPDYPEIDQITNEIKKLPNHIIIDAKQIAKDIGSPKSANIVVLGAAADHIGIEFNHLEVGIRKLFGNKGEKVINANLEALRSGREFAKKYED